MYISMNMYIQNVCVLERTCTYACVHVVFGGTAPICFVYVAFSAAPPCEAMAATSARLIVLLGLAWLSRCEGGGVGSPSQKMGACLRT